jgi:hypothetical protein
MIGQKPSQLAKVLLTAVTIIYLGVLGIIVVKQSRGAGQVASLQRHCVSRSKEMGL